MPGPRLLLIDDSPEVATLVRWLARRAGQNVTTAPTAEDGLVLLGTEPAFDLILVDVNLPGMDGIEFCQQVGSRAPPPPVAVFIQSGLFDDLARAVSVGVEYVLYKDALKEPDMWAQRCTEILDGLAGRLPAWLLRCLQATSIPDLSVSPSTLIPQALDRGLGAERAAVLSPPLLARAWRQVLGEDSPDLGRELSPHQWTLLAASLTERLWRLLGTDESRALRVALEPILPGVSGTEPTP
jgi:CheY-like chemotaxis protein